eukprot:CAMPEP_0172363668 /NCGR_PEP_ID=MMETSP1060-20121228/6962_1 /TAXON_ID=37318 /ORGANISM="Pseudo-nitzschia pungens, Strain cf. cingulata" /LENGTH=853 /DNA_ID=CAMNT_0013086457 /DNA_START=53 /DNA_END=2614 /DNA_ORIENTATION=+
MESSASSSSLGLRFGVGSLFRNEAGLASSATAGNDNDYNDNDNDYNEHDCDYEEDYECNEDEVEEEEEEDGLPIISIELERLVGYVPTNRDETESIRNQLIDAMWMRYKTHNNNNDNTNTNTNNTNTNTNTDNSGEEKGESEEQQQYNEDEPPPDFDDQIKELLDSRVARFGRVFLDDEETEDHEPKPSSDIPYLEIPYPSKTIIRSNGSNTTTNTNNTTTTNNNNNVTEKPEDTANLWSVVRGLAYALEEYDSEEDVDEDEVLDEADDGQVSRSLRRRQSQTPKSDPSFWYNLSEHLEHTGRMLSWKHAMALELRDCLRREVLHKKHELWVRERRTLKLEQLYKVRETLVHRTDAARNDRDRLASDKEDHVRRDMLLYDHQQKRLEHHQHQHRLQQNGSCGGGGGGGILGGSDLSFPEEFQLLGLLPKDQLYEEDDWGGTLDDEDDYDYYNSDYSNSDYSDDGYSDEDDYAGGDEDEHDDDCEREREREDDDKSNDNDNDNDQQTLSTRQKSTSLSTNKEPPFKEASTAAFRGNEYNDDEYNDDEYGEKNGTLLREAEVALAASAPLVPRPFLRRNRERRKKKARALQKKEVAESYRREALAKRKAHRELLEARHTTQELVLAQALLEALENKVRDVEELLESLQDEVWEAEEEAEKEELLKELQQHRQQQQQQHRQQQQQQQQQQNGSNDKEQGLSLLDQVLAMILGALPMEPGSKDREDHFRYVRREHEFIINGWKEYFGRLPPAFVPSSSSSSDSPNATSNDEEDEDEGSQSESLKPTSAAAGAIPRARTIATVPSVKLSKITKRNASNTKPSSAAPPVPSVTPEEQRIALGIVDNEDGEWDDDSNDGE